MEFFYAASVGFILLASGAYFFLKSRSSFALLLPFVYGYFSVLASCLYLELFPSYIYEQDLKSFLNGASLALLLLIIISSLATVIGFETAKSFFKPPRKANRLLSSGILVTILSLEVLLVSHILYSGSPLFEPNVSKFNFWKDQAIVEQLSVFNWALYPILFFVGANGPFFLYPKASARKILSLSIFAMGLMYYISWGNKFSAIILVIFFYFIPGLISFKSSTGNPYPIIRRNILLLVAVLLATGTLVSTQYERFQSRGLNIQEQLIERIFVLQGHVWWGSFNTTSLTGDFGQALSEIRSVFPSENKDSFGMQYLMEKLAPPALHLSYVESGVEFTGGYPAILILIFGLILGGAISAVLWFFFGIFLRYFNNLILSRSRARLFLSAYIYLTSLSFFLHGTLASFVNWKLFVVTCAIAIIEFSRLSTSLNKAPSFNNEEENTFCAPK